MVAFKLALIELHKPNKASVEKSLLSNISWFLVTMRYIVAISIIIKTFIHLMMIHLKTEPKLNQL